MISEPAIVLRIPRAASASPLNAQSIPFAPEVRSTRTSTAASTMNVIAIRPGKNQNEERSSCQRERRVPSIEGG